MPYLTRLKHVALILQLVVAAAAFAAPESSRPIRIGIITDLTGPSAYFGLQVQAGAKLAEKQLREKGMPVEVLLEDNGMSAPRAAAAAQKLIRIDGVDAVYVNFTAMVRAVAPVVKDAGLLMLYSAAAVSVSRESEFFFKTYVDNIQGCEAVAREFQRRGIRNIGVLRPIGEFGDLCSEGVKRVYAEPTEIEYAPGAPSLYTEVLSLKRRGVEAIINPSFENDVISTVKAAKQLQMKIPFGFDDTSITPSVMHECGTGLEGSLSFGFRLLPDSYIAEAGRMQGNAHLESYEAMGLSWLHVYQLAYAVVRCNPRTPKCIASELGNSPPEPLVGFDRWEDRKARIITVVRKVVNGRFEEVGTFLSNQ